MGRSLPGRGRRRRGFTDLATKADPVVRVADVSGEHSGMDFVGLQKVSELKNQK